MSKKPIFVKFIFLDVLFDQKYKINYVFLQEPGVCLQQLSAWVKFNQSFLSTHSSACKHSCQVHQLMLFYPLRKDLNVIESATNG